MKLQIRCRTELAQKIADLFSRTEDFDASAVSWFEVSSDEWCVDSFFSHKPDLKKIQHLISNQLGVLQVDYSMTVENVAEVDWVSKVQNDLAPVRAGRFVVYGSHDRTQIVKNRCALEINAGQAFGTAHHGTTRGCLLALDGLIKLRSFRSVLDIGTGSGILSIALARTIRPDRLLAFDIDPVAVITAKDNCRLNHVGQLVNVFTGQDLKHAAVRAAAPFDLICANILMEPLKVLAHDIAMNTAQGGFVVLSGLLDHQAPSLLAYYKGQKFALERRFSLEGWTTLVLRRISRKSLSRPV